MMKDFRESGVSVRRTWRKTTLFAGFIAVLVCSVLLVSLVFPSRMVSLVHGIALPLWSFGEEQLSDPLGLKAFFASKQTLLSENSRLKAELAAESALRLRLAGAEEENARLRVLLGRSTTTPGVAAWVLAAPPRVLYDTLVIDVGLGEGLRAGDIAVWEGVAVGTLDRVGNRSSVVSLFSAPGKETPVLIGPDNLPATAVGQGGGTFVAEVPRELEVSEGALVRLSARTFPVFGVVEHIESPPASPVHQLFFKLPMNLYTVRFVSVIPRAFYEE